MRWVLLGAVAGLTSAVLMDASPQAEAQQSPERTACVNAPPDAQIEACTEIIQSGRDTVHNLAIAHVYRGAAYDKKGDTDRAIADFSKAIELYPEFAIAYFDRGTEYANKGDVDGAIADFTKAIVLNPAKAAAAYYNRGTVYANNGDIDRAIADFTGAIDLDPENAAAYNNRGNAYKHKGDYDRAIADLTAGVSARNMARLLPTFRSQG